MPPDDPLAWVESLGGSAPSHIPAWPPRPGHVVVVLTEAIIGGVFMLMPYVRVAVSEDDLNALAAVDSSRKRIFFQVPEDRLEAAASAL